MSRVVWVNPFRHTTAARAWRTACALTIRIACWSMGNEAAFDADAVAEYVRCFSDPEAIRASCDDYRAAAGLDCGHFLPEEAPAEVADRLLRFFRAHKE
jgi:hypothetical protein